MSAEKREWWRVVLEWKLESEDHGTRYAYVTKDTERIAIFGALNALILDATLAAGDTVRVLSCDPHARTRKCKVDELEEVP
jgi:hypothetical protein